MEKYAMERVSLRSIVEEPYAPVVSNTLSINTMEKYAMERVSLRSIVEEPYAPVDRLLSALCKHIDCSAQTINSFAVDLQETAINKNSVQKFDKIITFLELEQCTLSKYAPSTPVKGSIFSKPYKAAMSTENEICLFPYDIDNELCKRITMGLSHTRKL
ncbi:unnamed protein product [Owenia fusiformis]|uniref:Uncharacterized protein n=1 Tax=Owenia fusiformis TaxID=6347 RepID=A0A8S4P3E1_OWEFU|nr:unnamed protein product [Owenia fusiformis]